MSEFKSPSRLLLLCWLAVLTLLTPCASQGLDRDAEAYLGASAAEAKLQSLYAKSKAWRLSFASKASSACSKHAGSLCSAGLSTDSKAQLLMATSPRAFDARSSSQMGGFSAVGQPKDQGECFACVAFAVLAAAQSAMACALKRDASSSLSEQDFFFCKSMSPGEERSCSSSWGMRSGVQAFIDLTQMQQYPVTETCMPYNPSNPVCYYDCKSVEGDMQKGRFSYLNLFTAWEVQDHVRKWGSAITRLDIWSDMRPFFDKNPSGVYPGPGHKATFQESHAVQMVGYDLDQGWWLLKNSWGSSFAAGGFFKVAFDSKVGVCSPKDTYGIKFNLNEPPKPPMHRLSPSTTRPGCYDYQAQRADYVAKVAATFGLPIQQVLLDNIAVLTELDTPLTDRTLVLCGISLPNGGTSGGGSVQKPAPAVPATTTPATPKVPPPAPNQQQQKPQPQQQQQPQPQQQQQQPQPQQQQQQQQPAAVQPGYQLVMGQYGGKVKCDIASMPGTITFTSDASGNVQQEFSAIYTLMWITCTYRVQGGCSVVAGGSWCGSSEEAWSCKYTNFLQYDDSCGGRRIVRASSVEFCYANRAVHLKFEKGTCNNFSGTLTLGGR